MNIGRKEFIISTQHQIYHILSSQLLFWRAVQRFLSVHETSYGEGNAKNSDRAIVGWPCSHIPTTAGRQPDFLQNLLNLFSNGNLVFPIVRVA